MRRRNTQVLLAILVLLGLALASLLVYDLRFKVGGFNFERKGLRLGLDLRGGTHLVLQADLSKVGTGERAEALQGAMNIIERRINAYGVAEPAIQQVGGDRILVQLPGVRDVNEAIRLIGQTAQLDFREPVLDGQGNIVRDAEGKIQWKPAEAEGSDGVLKHLTGQYLRRNAAVVLDPQTNEPQVSFEWNSEGARLFEQITSRLLQKPLGIFLDNELISAPIVRAVIRAQGVIEGLDINEARTLAIQLNAGALPVPVAVVQQTDVDATLGEDSVKRSILAGEIGLGVVFLFMIIYYRLPGLLASGALIAYAILALAVFKLVPVTLTLAGIAGFILSIGMAVDANILVFERLKEELRWGRTLGAAIESGFDRAWPSIRDSNISTFITCGILYWFGSRFGASMVMGFAFTLFIGVAVSMFTALTVSRAFLRAIIKTPLARSISLFRPL